MSGDPRLAGALAAGVLHACTILGVFLLASRFLSFQLALAAALMYAFSGIGLAYAGTLWPRALPSFVVWMAWWTCRWASSGRALDLAASLVTWAAGTYVFLEMAPALLIVPALWVLRRPPVDLRAVALALLIAVVMWWPYLQLQVTRGGLDLRSQLLVERVASPIDTTWCDPALAIPMIDQDTSTGHSMSPATVLLAAGRRLLGIGSGLIANFRATLPVSVLLLTLTLFGLLCLIRPGRMHSADREHSTVQRFWLSVGAGAIAFALVANEYLVGRYVAPLAPSGELLPDTLRRLRHLQVLAATFGVMVLARRPLAAGALALSKRFESAASDTRIIAVAFLVPWLALLLMVEHGRPIRFAWLMPLQVIVMAAGVGALRSGTARIASAAVLVVLLSPMTPANAIPWVTQGWSGKDHPMLRAASTVADRVKASGRTQASVGYQGHEDVAEDELLQVYRLGSQFDLLLRYDGVRNTNRCPEGISAADEFRIVRGDDLYADLPGPGFTLLGTFGDHRVHVRTPR